MIPTKTHDAQAVKKALGIAELFEREKITLKRAGTSLMCLSPFTNEKTPSCSVDPEKGVYFCYSSGKGGDIFSYWQETRGVSFAVAVDQLGALTNLSPSEWSAETTTRISPAPQETPLADPLSDAEVEKWNQSCLELLRNETEIARIATWRGYDTRTVIWAAETRLLGFSARDRILKFLVTRPGSAPGQQKAIGVHSRPAMETNARARWKYTPLGIGAWPMVIGNPDRARVLFILEGQWDALALADLMKWHENGIPNHVAVLALRGATAWRKLIDHQPLAENVRIILILDRDKAGLKWAQGNDCFANKLKAKCGPKALVKCFAPSRDKSDLNDLTKAKEITRAEFSKTLKYWLTLPAPKPPTFLRWIREHRDYASHAEHAAAMRWILADKREARPTPISRAGRSKWFAYWDLLASGRLGELEDFFPGVAALRSLRLTYEQYCFNNNKPQELTIYQ